MPCHFINTGRITKSYKPFPKFHNNKTLINDQICIVNQYLSDMATQDKNTIKQTFPVLGMTCAGCASSAESIVQQQEGVVEASVNFATGNLTVVYKHTLSRSEQLQKALRTEA